jgi:hypothetical protein
MFTCVHAWLILAEAAEQVNGKLFVSGGGWNEVERAPVPLVLAGMVFWPWSAQQQDHELRLQLLSSDGAPVHLAGQAEALEVHRTARTEQDGPVGRPHVHVLALTLPVTAAELDPGIYEWRLMIDGADSELWSAAFRVLD